MSWKPSASLEAVKARAALYHAVREFFQMRQVLEVDVPLLSPYATVDPFINSMVVSGASARYLQTSPEFFLKRFLATYQADCYYLGKAFREEERGARHHPEFTLLEWYRVAWDEVQLGGEVVQLLQHVLPEMPLTTLSYADLFYDRTCINPHTASVSELRGYAQSQLDIAFDSADKNTWLDIVFTHCIEPTLSQGIVVIEQYPQSQAALARIEHTADGIPVARRFEVYVNGVELANGYWELFDGEEQQQRFGADMDYRQQNNLPEYPCDQKLVEALKGGHFPSCAGVALGIDRLLMCLLQRARIDDVLTFA